jgi:hypothetical protein
MSSFVDDTSSLTTLTATQPRTSVSAEVADPAEVAEASRAPVGSKQKRKRTSWIWTHGEEVSVDGAAYWQCSLCENRVEPKQYKVSAGTRAPAIHLKDKHAVEEEISRKAKRLEVQKGNIEQAVETTQRIQKQKAVGLTGPPGGGGASSQEWNEDVHKALLVSVRSGAFVSSSASGI